MITDNIPLPRLLNASGGTERSIHPITVNINLKLTPLSYASMTLPHGETIPARSYIELYTCMGSAGVFRVRSPQDSYGEDNATAELEHAIVEVGDYLVLNKYEEMMAANTAMSTVFSHYRGSKWQLGSTTALGTSQIGLKVDHDRVLEAMLALLDQVPGVMMTFDFTTTPWTVGFAAKGVTVAAEGRLSRNLSYAKIIYDDTELCTRAYYERPIDNAGRGQDKTEWVYVDADTMSTYGLIEKEVQTGSSNTAAEANRAAQEYIRTHKELRITVEISAEELSCITGEPLDTFTVGKLFRLALPDYGVTVEKHITELAFENVYGSPRSISVNLAEEEDTAVNFIHDLDKKGGSGGGGGGKKKQDDELKGTRSRWIQEADRIGMVVEGYGEYANIKAASVVASINAQTGQSMVKISADVIDIDGLVTALGVVSQVIRVNDFSVLNSLASPHISDGRDALVINTQTFTFYHQQVSWQDYVARSVSLGTRRYFLYSSGSGNTTPSGTARHYPVTDYTDTTIHYLGKAST